MRKHYFQVLPLIFAALLTHFYLTALQGPFYVIEIISFSSRKYNINPFPADVANQRHLSSAPKSHFCDLTGKTEVIGLSVLMTLSIDLGCLYMYCKQSIQCFQKHTKLIESRFSRSKILQNSIDQIVRKFSQGASTPHLIIQYLRLALRETLRFHSWR
jgi:hypothetical protein